jgi:hypothetical protein
MCSALRETEQVSHSYKTTGRVTVFDRPVSTLRFFDGTLEDKGF